MFEMCEQSFLFTTNVFVKATTLFFSLTQYKRVCVYSDLNDNSTLPVYLFMPVFCSILLTIYHKLTIGKYSQQIIKFAKFTKIEFVNKTKYV